MNRIQENKELAVLAYDWPGNQSGYRMSCKSSLLAYLRVFPKFHLHSRQALSRRRPLALLQRKVGACAHGDSSLVGAVCHQLAQSFASDHRALYADVSPDDVRCIRQSGGLSIQKE